MNAYFDRMQELADDKTLFPRVRFMLQVWCCSLCTARPLLLSRPVYATRMALFCFRTARPLFHSRPVYVAVALLPPSAHDVQDVIDLRANKWVPRRDNRMRTIGEIRKEVTDIRQSGFLFLFLATAAVQTAGSMIRILPC
jgi:hypothetical protein